MAQPVGMARSGEDVPTAAQIRNSPFPPHPVIYWFRLSLGLESGRSPPFMSLRPCGT